MKNLGAGSDGSYTEVITPFSPAKEHPESISNQTKSKFITSLMGAGGMNATTQKTLAAPKPHLTGNVIHDEALCSSSQESASSLHSGRPRPDSSTDPLDGKKVQHSLSQTKMSSSKRFYMMTMSQPHANPSHGFIQKK